MDLYLLRHGIAADVGQSGIVTDAERPLTAEGIARMKSIAAALRAMRLEFDLLLTSPLVRARETADLVAAALKAHDRLLIEASLACGRPARDVLQRLAACDPRPESVLLVGHEPDLSRLISLLVSGETGFPVTMKKGGLCKLSAAWPLRARCATLEWLLTPKQMLLMG